MINFRISQVHVHVCAYAYIHVHRTLHVEDLEKASVSDMENKIEYNPVIIFVASNELEL